MHSTRPEKLEDHAVRVRLPVGLKTEVKVRAARNRRTMNSEIIVLLEAGLATLDGANEKAADERELADR